VRDGIVHFIEAAELSGQNRRFAHLYDWFSWVYTPSMRGSFAFIGMTERSGRSGQLGHDDDRCATRSAHAPDL
jgi:hypothetical protein